jgi:glycosyltransferase involved in cell wall biosynthesis
VTDRPLRIAVDLTAVLPGGDNGGAKVLTVELLSSLARLGPQHSFLLLTARDTHDEFAHLEALGMERRCVLETRRAAPVAADSAGPRTRLSGRSRDALRLLLPPALRRAGNRAWSRLRGEPRFGYGEPDPRNRGLVEEGIDVLFCPFTAPVRAEPDLPVVSVVYDLQHLAYPQFFTPQECANRHALLRVLEERADRLVCISEYARGRFLANLRVPPDRVITIPIAVHGRLPRRTPDETRAALARLAIDRPYVFYPANFWPHKNHRLLLTAYGALRARRASLVPDLVLTGALAEPAADLAEAARAMGLAEHVRLLGYLPDADLAAVFEGATLVVFPSLYEGFGMPVLEAMHFGKPVACSDVTSLPEVAGDAALFFDPRRPEAVAAALERLLDDADLRASLARRGEERVAALDPAGMARAYLDVLAAAAQGADARGPWLAGVHPDGWLGERLALSVGARGTCELDLFAPYWLKARAVAVTASAHGRSLGAWQVPRDGRATIRFAVADGDRRVEIRFAPVFRPAGSRSGGDQRVLTCQCEGARLLDEAGAHDLLAAG